MRHYWLLINKLISIGIRPLAVVVEAYFVNAYETRLLPIVIPASMLVMAIVSVPIHKDFFQSESDSDLSSYLRSLNGLLVVSVASSILYFYFELERSVGWIVLLMIAGNVISDKITDEANRYLEYKKKYFLCIAVQLLRNFWLFVYCSILAFEVYGEVGLIAMTISAQIIISVIMLKSVFQTKSKNRKLTEHDYISSIALNAPYAISGLLPSWMLNTARLSVAIGFPAYGSMFLLATQMSAVLSLLIDVFFVSKFRKLIARKPLVYLRIIHTAAGLLFLAVNMFIAMSLLSYKFGFATDLQLLIAFAIFLVMISTLSGIFSEILFWSLLRVEYFCMGAGLFLVIVLVSWLLDANAEMLRMLIKSIILFDIYYLALNAVARMRLCK